MSLLSLPSGAKLREDHFLGDLTSLFRRHDVPTGTPECLLPLAVRLNESRSMRSDLYMLCSAISRMSASDLTPDEQLSLVARAATGSRDVAIPEELKAAFLPGLHEWSTRAVSTQGMYREFQPEPEPTTAMQPPRISRFSAAAARSRGDAASFTPSATPREIRSDTPIGDLTISQLRDYIEDIEQRMDRLQPYLASLNAEAPQAAPPATIEPTPILAVEDKANEPELKPEFSGITEHSRTTEFSRIKERLDAKEQILALALAEEAEASSTEAPAIVEDAAAVESHEATLAEPALLLRGSSASSSVPALELKPEPTPELKPELVLFRSITDTEPKPAKDHNFFYTVGPAVAALLLLLPGVYYGLQHYLYPELPALSRTLFEPPKLTLIPPPAPEYPPTSILDAPTEAVPTTKPSALPHNTATNSAPHAEHMEADAARAEAENSNTVQ